MLFLDLPLVFLDPSAQIWTPLPSSPGFFTYAYCCILGANVILCFSTESLRCMEKMVSDEAHKLKHLQLTWWEVSNKIIARDKETLSVLYFRSANKKPWPFVTKKCICNTQHYHLTVSSPPNFHRNRTRNKYALLISRIDWIHKMGKHELAQRVEACLASPSDFITKNSMDLHGKEKIILMCIVIWRFILSSYLHENHGKTLFEMGI